MRYKKHHSTSILAGDINDMDQSENFDGECGLNDLKKFFSESGCSEDLKSFRKIICRASELDTKIDVYFKKIVEKSEIALEKLMNEEEFWEDLTNQYKKIIVTPSKNVEIMKINFFMLGNSSNIQI